MAYEITREQAMELANKVKSMSPEERKKVSERLKDFSEQFGEIKIKEEPKVEEPKVEEKKVTKPTVKKPVAPKPVAPKPVAQKKDHSQFDIESENQKFANLVQLIQEANPSEMSDFSKENVSWIDRITTVLEKLGLEKTVPNVKKITEIGGNLVNFKHNDEMLRKAGFEVEGDYVWAYGKKIPKHEMGNIGFGIVKGTHDFAEESLPTPIKNVINKFGYKAGLWAQTIKNAKKKGFGHIIDEIRNDRPAYDIGEKITKTVKTGKGDIQKQITPIANKYIDYYNALESGTQDSVEQVKPQKVVASNNVQTVQQPTQQPAQPKINTINPVVDGQTGPNGEPVRKNSKGQLYYIASTGNAVLINGQSDLYI